MSRSEVSLTSAFPSTRIDLIDHAGKVLATGSGSLQTTAEPGLYTAQVNVGSSTRQEVIVVKGDSPLSRAVDVSVEAATPVRSTTTNHEFHSEAAQRLSRQPQTRPGSGSRLVVFVRVLSAEVEAAQQTIGDPGVKLLDSVLTPVEVAPWELGPGYSAISLDLDPGTYVLRSHASHGTVDQTIVTSSDWTTLAFIPVWPEPDESSAFWKISVDAMTVHMTRLGNQFDPYQEGSESVLAAEAALQGLRSGDIRIARDVLNRMLYDKFSNPMLGIYAAHALLMERDVRWGTAEIVVRNLRQLVPGHPDADALFLLLKEKRRDKSKSRVSEFELPPMLYNSYQAVIAHDAYERTLIADGSIAERAASHLRLDGAWTRWDTLDEEPEPAIAADPSLVDSAARAISDLLVTDELTGDAAAEPGNLSSESIKMARYLTEIADQEQGSGTAASKMDLTSFSRQMNLPVSKVRRDLRAIGEASSIELA